MADAVIMAFLQPLWPQAKPALLVVQHLHLGSPSIDEHKQIVQAICNRDPELAEMLMRRHITYTKNNIEKKLLKS